MIKQFDEFITHINEISKGFAQEAFNAATGAQKNRIKKLYKEIYGDDLESSNISNIKFTIFNTSEERVLNEFKKWNQKYIDNISSISYDADAPSPRGHQKQCRIQFTDKPVKWYTAEWCWNSSREDYELSKWCKDQHSRAFLSKLENYTDDETFIAAIYEDIKSQN